MKNKLLVVSTGFALFSMFFGSGNLVFPLMVGKESGGHFLLATLGILLTGVLVPFMGAWAMMLFNGSSREFFGSMGKIATFWFPLIALSLMGPFGVLARCITVAHGSFRLLFPETSLALFSLVSCGVIYLLTVNKNRIIPLLGSFLTPFLLVALAAIACFGFWKAEWPEITTLNAWEPLKNGIFQGYQTMDLLAAFFFSAFILKHLDDRSKISNSSQSRMKVFTKAAFLGAGLLSAVYFALVFLGSVYTPLIATTPPQEMLGVIAQEAMGQWSAPAVCIAVILACLTTAVVLATLFADFLKKEVSTNKLSSPLAMVITLMIAFFVSTQEFAGIAKFLSPILETLYPALIVLTVLNICSKYWGFPPLRWPVALTLATKLCFF